MLDPIISFFTRLFYWIGRGIGYLVGLILWPFLWLGRWYGTRGLILKAVLGALLVLVVGLYGYFFWTTQRWTNFDPLYAQAYGVNAANADAGQPVGQAVVPETGATAPAAADAATAGEGAARTCLSSQIVRVTADLTDFNVNQNPWVSSMVLYKLGFFGLDWDRTPFFDNKAAFQRGINQAARRTSTELVEVLGRVRATSSIDNDLQKARGDLQFDEETWYLGATPPWLRTPTPTYYRSAITSLRAFNDRLQKCEAVFDARADNLARFIDRVSNDLGSTAAILSERSENYDGGWFDTRADDRFWFAYGQLYGYYGVLTAAHADFRDVIAQRGLTQLWTRLEEQLARALRVQPAIIANGAEDSILMPSHLATINAYVLRVNAVLEETRSVLER
ncbi:DUF2333 family protein [Mesorhizobium sp. RP14(2022)]|uniref:DUF2333 family protein n=1 Tax=Mesorhizobium liriopis TaxID=2953882 RepID=A0ABT1CA79_9HYPH|nr:DUF2333 family protein [Mesorhizobium liriopis]MCO6051095.1 DUF2333 family protein [Mesorhizobium liriopis]